MSPDTVELPREFKDDRWRRCRYCGSDSNSVEYDAELYSGENMQNHLHGRCDDLEASMATNLNAWAGLGGHPRTFLDVGCCTGDAMRGMRSRGYSVMGFDVMPYAADCIDAAVVIGKELEADMFKGCQFGAIMLREVIEHIVDWKKTLIECEKLLHTSGFIQIQTPRPANEYNDIGYQRQHMQLFSPYAMIRFAKQAGFHRIHASLIWDIGHLYVLSK